MIIKIRNKTQKGFGRIAVVLICAITGVVGALALYLVTVYPPAPQPRACTKEAMLCPDGKTYVSRTGPKCEFAPCPSVSPTISASPSVSPSVMPSVDTTGWKTYRNEEYGFEVKYPNDWGVEESTQRDVEGIFLSFGPVKGKISIYHLGVFKGSVEEDIIKKISGGDFERYNQRIAGIDMVAIPRGNSVTDADLYFERNGSVYHFTESFAGLPEHKQAIYGIIQSFKFL